MLEVMDQFTALTRLPERGSTLVLGAEVVSLCEFFGLRAAKEWSEKETTWHTPDPIEYLYVLEVIDAPDSVQNNWHHTLSTDAGEEAMMDDPRFLAFRRGWDEYRQAHPDIS